MQNLPLPWPRRGCLRLLQVVECFGGTAVAQAGRELCLDPVHVMLGRAGKRVAAHS